METVGFCAELLDLTSRDVVLGILIVETMPDVSDVSIPGAVKDTESGADDIACEDCVGASENVSDAEGSDIEEATCEDCVGASKDVGGVDVAGVERTAELEDFAGLDASGLEDGAVLDEGTEPGEVAGADESGSEEFVGAWGFVDVLVGVEDAAGSDAFTGVDDTVGKAQDGTGSKEISGTDEDMEIVDVPIDEGEGATELCCGPPGPTGPPPVQEA